MKKLIGIVAFATVVFCLSLSNPLYARGPGGGVGRGSGAGSGSGSGSRAGFVDANGDSRNDRAKDSNGDGVLNGQDPTYVRPQDGTGSKNGRGAGNGTGISTTPAAVTPVATP
jgi:hypothetical protein